MQTGDALGTSCGVEQRELREEAVCERELRFGLEFPQGQGRVLGRQQAEPGLRGGCGQRAGGVRWRQPCTGLCAHMSRPGWRLCSRALLGRTPGASRRFRASPFGIQAPPGAGRVTGDDHNSMASHARPSPPPPRAAAVPSRAFPAVHCLQTSDDRAQGRCKSVAKLITNLGEAAVLEAGENHAGA